MKSALQSGAQADLGDLARNSPGLRQMLMLEKSWFYNRTSFFVYSWTNCVPVL